MTGLRTATSVALAVALGLGTAVTALAGTPAATDDGAGVVTHELDLSGVDASAAADLPATPPAPAEGDVGIASTTPAPDPDVLTAALDTEPFSVLGLTWDAAGTQDVVVRYRVHVDGAWTDWEAVGASDVAPDAGSREAGSGARGATDPIVAIGADGLQVWAEAGTGTVSGLSALLVDPGEDPASVSAAALAVPVMPATSGTTGTAAVTPAAGSHPAPTIIRRSEWGADESLKTCEPDLSTEIVSAAVHHTASTTSYTAADVPGLLRGFLAYHTAPESAGGRGWCDIGYNFLVDQFGRVFEGRAGSIERSVVGVHTGGFNSRTIGVAAIGTFTSVAPTQAMLEGISQTVAWKFAEYRILGNATVSMVSGGGASKYPAGTVVTFPTIYGHRDAQLTSCPGELLYGALGAIRARVASLIDAYVPHSPYGNWERSTATTTSVTLSGWVHDPDTSSPIELRAEVNGVPVTVVANGARPDVDAAVPTAGPAHGFTVTVPRSTRTVVCLRALNVAGGYDTTLGCRAWSISNATPIGQLDSVSAGSGTLTARGWTIDPDTTAPIDVAVWVDGKGYWTTASLERPDVAAVYPSAGSAHGYSLTVPVGPGRHEVCATAINVPGGTNPPLGCRTVTVADTLPTGQIDQAAVAPGGLVVRGWALDRDTTAPINVAVWVDGKGYWTTASLDRPDVGAAFGLGSAHGYALEVPAAPGLRQVCVTAVGAHGGASSALGCRQVLVGAQRPVGHLDAATADGGSLLVRGWALDPDTTGPIDVALWVDGKGYWTTASLARADIAAAYPRYGAAHGFALRVPVAPGRHTVCAVAVNRPSGPNTDIGCLTATG